VKFILSCAKWLTVCLDPKYYYIIRQKENSREVAVYDQAFLGRQLPWPERRSAATIYQSLMQPKKKF
jgi:hypothetical protein